MVGEPRGDINPKSIYILGVDLARLGQDSTVFLVIEKPFNSDDLYIVYLKEFPHNLLTEIVDYTKYLDQRFHFDKIYMDTTGLGAGPYDELTRDPSYSYRTGDCKFSSNIDGKPFKEVAYNNLKMLLERRVKGLPGGLHLPDHKKLLWELVDLRYEITTNGRVKIHHSLRGHDDYSDALVLACLHFRPGEQKQGIWDVA